MASVRWAAAQPCYWAFATLLDWVLLGSFLHGTLFPTVLPMEDARIQAVFPKDPAFLLATAAVLPTVTTSVPLGWGTFCAALPC